METEIQIMTLPLPLGMGSVNCYLVPTESGFILFDTGGVSNRTRLVEALEGAGCHSGDLTLIVLTHGDFDHCGNAAYLRQMFDSKVAMHIDDSGMVERGDMFWNRQQPNLLIKLISPLIVRLGRSNRFVPDIYLDEGEDLSQYGLAATVVHLPGHSRGSIGIRLAGNGNLIGGDLLENRKKPNLNSLMDDLTAANASVEKLAALDIQTVYPGHGQPFPLRSFLNSQS
jgi:hydroxyacylglutathione hydrolase